MIYDSIAILIENWTDDKKQQLLSEGWEYKYTKGSYVVYCRKNLDGELNTTDQGWNKE